MKKRFPMLTDVRKALTGSELRPPLAAAHSDADLETFPWIDILIR
jgi:hypothetical protein